MLSPKKAGTCKYVVCCRKPAWNNKKEKIDPRAAFLIGVIAGLRKQPGSENDRGQPRFLIELSEYDTSVTRGDLEGSSQPRVLQNPQGAWH